jgi:hypothetical protein
MTNDVIKYWCLFSIAFKWKFAAGNLAIAMASKNERKREQGPLHAVQMTLAP